MVTAIASNAERSTRRTFSQTTGLTMLRIEDIQTPAVLIDLDKVEANLKRAQDYADSHSLPLRPHIKTHKLPRFAKRQIELGAQGITCQKISEAEVMADHGITDIFLPYNILGQAKLERLVALARRTQLRVTADSVQTIDGLSEAFEKAGLALEVLVECDTGMGRCGVPDHETLVTLARHIDASPALTFSGIMTYPAAGQLDKCAQWLERAVNVLTESGLPPKIVSNGGTPDFWSAHVVEAATEHRPGTYIYLDRYQVAAGVGTLEDCALTVLATVVSHPTPDRAVIDAGSKALTSDTLGMDGFGHVVGIEGAAVKSLSEEHGVLTLSGSAALEIGQRIEIIPNHACVVSNLFDSVYLVSNGEIVAKEPVAARGKVE
ncbi:alanine racemase [Pelagibacterium lentulum]|uniref:Alanine racemase n=2 Tax=Pelagibacterium lentulum TaxID=2029865 RepID=A0A916RCD1_9HYPH|nr:alanine racemase [Pelagibacterium lentulum]